MSLIGLLIVVIVFGLLFYCVSLLPLPAPWGTIARVLLLVIAIIWLLSMLGVVGGGTTFHIR